MAKSEHKNAATELFNLPALSQVSFPSTCRSLNIEGEGTRVGRARLESLRATPGVQFALSAEQLDHYTTARQFLQELYGELGLSLPETGPPFVYDHRFTETAGICDTLLRAPAIQYLSDHVRSREGYVAGWVHELTHASGAVRWGGMRSPANDSRWRFTVTRAGWMMRLGGKSALFSALEEYTATVNQCVYLSEVRGLTSTVAEEECSLSFYVQRQTAVRTFQLCTQLFDSKRFAEVETSSRSRRWERAFLENGGKCSVYTPRMRWLKDGAETNIFIYDIYPLLDEFAREVFPKCSAVEASVSFRELALKAHVTGDLTPLLRTIKDTLGREAVRFLADWGPREGDIMTQDDLALLCIFVRAGRLGADEARSYRADLLCLLEERKGKEGQRLHLPLRIESLLRDAKSGRWESWMREENRQLIADEPELQEEAAESFQRAFDGGDLTEAARISIAGALNPNGLPRVELSTVRDYARKLLSEGEVLGYEVVVQVFSPRERVVPRAEEQQLVYAAAVSKLRSRNSAEFTRIAKSSLCDESTLVSDEICHLASEVMRSFNGIQSKVSLFSALPKKVQDRISPEVFG